MGSPHSQENVRMIDKRPLWNKVLKIGDIADTAHTASLLEEL
jgi:hypothetical protein